MANFIGIIYEDSGLVFTFQNCNSVLLTESNSYLCLCFLGNVELHEVFLNNSQELISSFTLL